MDDFTLGIVVSWKRNFRFVLAPCSTVEITISQFIARTGTVYVQIFKYCFTLSPELLKANFS